LSEGIVIFLQGQGAQNTRTNKLKFITIGTIKNYSGARVFRAKHFMINTQEFIFVLFVKIVIL